MLPIDFKELHFHYKSESSPTDLDVRHCHDKYELLFVVAGTGKCIVEGRAIDVRPGSVIIVSPLQYHYLALDGGSFERFVVHFRRDSLYPEAEAHLNSILLPEGLDGVTAAALLGNTAATEHLSHFDLARRLSALQGYNYMRMLVSQLIILLSATDREEPAEESGELGARVIRYLNMNIDRDISLDDLARYFFVSKYYLCRAFKRYNGISVHGYITKKRIMRAKGLIESGVSASDAAYRIGFGDYSAFYRAYTKTVGHPPSADAERRTKKRECDGE